MATKRTIPDCNFAPTYSVAYLARAMWSHFLFPNQIFFPNSSSSNSFMTEGASSRVLQCTHLKRPLFTRHYVQLFHNNNFRLEPEAPGNNREADEVVFHVAGRSGISIIQV